MSSGDDRALDDLVVVELAGFAKTVCVNLGLIVDAGFEVRHDAAAQIGPLGGAAVEHLAVFRFRRARGAAEPAVEFRGPQRQQKQRKVAAREDGGAARLPPPVPNDEAHDDHRKNRENTFEQLHQAAEESARGNPGDGTSPQREKPSAERQRGKEREQGFVADEALQFYRHAVERVEPRANQQRPDRPAAQPDARHPDGQHSGEGTDDRLRVRHRRQSAAGLQDCRDEQRVDWPPARTGDPLAGLQPGGGRREVRPAVARPDVGRQMCRHEPAPPEEARGDQRPARDFRFGRR